MVKMMMNLKKDFVKVQRSGLVEGSDYSHLAIAKFDEEILVVVLGTFVHTASITPL